jgi:uncharacterized protein DUF1488
MPLENSGLKHVTHSNLRAVGFWMCVKGADPVQPVRVLVTYDALAQLDPSQVRDLEAALLVFDENRPQIEAAASMKFDAMEIEPESYEGQPMIKLTTDDLT